jgi:hypothetical protein
MKFILISLMVLAFSTVIAEADADKKKGYRGGLLSVDSQTYHIAGWHWDVALDEGGATTIVGPAEYNDVEILLNSNELTAFFLENLVTLDVINELRIETGNVSLELRDVRVSGLSMNNPGKESVTLSYLEFTYAVNGISICYNLETGTQCD